MRTQEIQVPFPVIAIFVSLASLAIILPTRRDELEGRFRYTVDGQQATQALRTFIESHRQCPPNLESIGVTAPKDAAMPLRYRAWDNRSQCEITAGDYGLDGNEDYWHYPPGEWRLYRD